MSKIKSFEDFSHDSNKVNEDLISDVNSIFGRMLPLLGTGFVKTVKQKLAASLLEKLGISENTEASTIIQEVVDAIEIKEIPGLLTGKNANAQFLAPRLAQAVQEYIQRKGFDSLYTQFGIMPNGWLASIIRESLQERMGKENLTKFFLKVLGEEPVGKDVINKLDDESKEKMKDALSQQLVKEYPEKTKSNSFGSFWEGLFGKSDK